MLQLRRVQIDVLDAHAQRAFELRLAEHLCQPSGDLPALPRAEALAMSDHAVARATAYGVEDDPSIIALADVYRRLGWGFEDLPEYEDVALTLRAPNISGTAKIAFLLEELSGTKNEE